MSSAMTETETTERFPTLVGDLYGYEELVPDRDRGSGAGCA